MLSLCELLYILWNIGLRPPEVLKSDKGQIIFKSPLKMKDAYFDDS